MHGTSVNLSLKVKVKVSYVRPYIQLGIFQLQNQFCLDTKENLWELVM